MTTNRMDAFSDGVIAIIVTIMVLEMKAPQNAATGSLLHIAPLFASYGLSFLVVAIMWVNHHHLTHSVHRVNGPLLWSNNNLLFWISLIPFVTAYLGHNHDEPLPVMAYGAVLGMCGLSFTLLRHVVSRSHEEHYPDLASHHHHMRLKDLMASVLYLSSAPLAYVSIYISYAIFVLIPAAYFIPDRRVEAASH